MTDPHDRLLTRLDTIARLDEGERAIIRTLPISVRDYTAGQDIVREGDCTTESLVVIEGLIHRYKLLASGGRQTLAFHVPGDVPDLQTVHLPLMDHTVAALTDSRIGAIPHKALQTMISDNPEIGVAFWREALIDAAKFREWIANLGGRNALQRTSHLLCELYLRLDVVGLAERGIIPFRLSQPQLSEALGISVVHINRTLKDLRDRGLVSFMKKQIHILDWPGLTNIADFNPDYLHMRDKPR